MLYLVFAAYSLLALPVRVNVTLDIEGLKGVITTELRAAGLDYSFETAIKPDGKEKRKRAHGMLRLLLKAAKIGSLLVFLRIGTGDALSTAMAIGGARAAVMSALGVLGALRGTQVQILPDFSRKCFVLRLRCIFSITVGDIMLSAAKTAIMKRRKEGPQWSSIPLRS